MLESRKRERGEGEGGGTTRGDYPGIRGEVTFAVDETAKRSRFLPREDERRHSLLKL